MSFRAMNAEYEAWLRTQCAVVERDLERKHEKMRSSAFAFLRATSFRWAARIERICDDLADAPQVLSVGDAHIENFGTWRDAEGRLVWGINDFDDAAVTPYPLDLLRLATSMRLFPGRIIGARTASEAILEGYRRGLLEPRPTLLDEQETWMRDFVACSDQERFNFWRDIDALKSANPPDAVTQELKDSMPDNASILRFARRAKGGGSLGRPRFVAIAAWRGGRIVREAKALVPSSWDWAHEQAAARSRFLDVATGRFRSPDPHLDLRGGFIVRRLAADSRKVERETGIDFELETDLLRAMGFDIGAIHADDAQSVAKIIDHLDGRPGDWLHKAAKKASAWVEADQAQWAVG